MSFSAGRPSPATYLPAYPSVHLSIYPAKIKQVRGRAQDDNEHVKHDRFLPVVALHPVRELGVYIRNFKRSEELAMLKKNKNPYSTPTPACGALRIVLFCSRSSGEQSGVKMREK